MILLVIFLDFNTKFVIAKSGEWKFEGQTHPNFNTKFVIAK